MDAIRRNEWNCEKEQTNLAENDKESLISRMCGDNLTLF